MSVALRSVLFAALCVSICSCNETLSPASNPKTPPTAAEFFWQTGDLDSGIDFYVMRNGTPNDHLLSTKDGVHVFDAAINGQALVAHVSGDDVTIDSIGSNTVFSLPSGYQFGHDSIPGKLLLLHRSQLDSGGTWNAGYLMGPGLQNGVPVIAHVIDRIDSLYIPPARPGGDSLFGESLVIEYEPALGLDSTSSPVLWTIYFARHAGPVLIEQYASRSAMDYKLGDHAQMVRH